MLAQPLVHIAEVGMDMVSVPVERVVLSAQVVAGEVPPRVAQAVELVPEQTPRTNRHWYHARSAIHINV